MATRSIVTSQPDVACDVCGRRLLRGESPDTYLAGREPRTVCELCAPRAAQEGWRRESDGDALSSRPPRGRRGVSLLDRLRGLRETAQPVPARRRVLDAETAFEPSLDLADEPELEPALEAFSDGMFIDESPPATDSPLPATSAQAQALTIFNEGEQPRRVAGVARSLGEPTVTVNALAEDESRFEIMVAWEICWYRYEVDLSDEPAEARLVEKGMELDELSSERRAGNAVADERGELHLLR